MYGPLGFGTIFWFDPLMIRRLHLRQVLVRQMEVFRVQFDISPVFYPSCSWVVGALGSLASFTRRPVRQG